MCDLREVAEPEKKMAKGLCVVYGCSKKRAGRTRHCPKHRRQDFKLRYPVQYQFDILRSSARKRKVDFELTFEEFSQFCIETGYMELKGRKTHNATIDRIRNKEGYKIGNLQILTGGDNIRKQHIDAKLEGYRSSWKEPPIDVSEFRKPPDWRNIETDVPF